MPTQGKPGRLGLAPIVPEHSFSTPKAARSRINQERVAKSERETDDHRLQQRQKQIDYGKNTTGYLNYVAEVPIDARTRNDPWTPDIHKKYPKRVWDVTVRSWRRQLHKYDIDGSSSLFQDSDPSAASSSPDLNASIDSEDSLIDSISSAIQKFQQDGQGHEHEEEDIESGQDSQSSHMDSMYYNFDSSVRTPSFSRYDHPSESMPYAPSFNFSLVEDSNSSVESQTSVGSSWYSDSMTSDYMSENSSDSFASMPLTPISMLGSPMGFQAAFTSGLSSATSSSTPIGHSSSASSASAASLTSTPPRGHRSASQHSLASSSPSSAFQHSFTTPSSTSSAFQHYSPYGAIGIPRFSLLSTVSPVPPSSTLNVPTNASSIFSGKSSLSQDENVENKPSHSNWFGH